jgi:hypothetical protein
MAVSTKPLDADGTVVLDIPPVLADPAADTIAGSSSPSDQGRTDWKFATLDNLRDAEDFLDSLEAQGVEHRELVILANACFAVRWR